MTGRGTRVLAVALAVTCWAGLLVGTASAGGYGNPSGSTPPPSTTAPQRDTVRPVSAPTRTCSIYGSSSGFGLLCSDAAAGKTLAQLFREAGIDVDKAFCWDDPDLPDGFEPDRVQAGPGAWFLDTCLTFDGAVTKANARLSYEYHFHAPGEERLLTVREQAVVSRVTGRGQIPFLQVQTSPISSPRVDQDVAFSMLCDAKVTCEDTAAGRRVSTAPLRVAGVTLHAELVHLRVLPEGSARPDEVVDCSGAGLAQTAEQLDQGSLADPRVCRYRYDRSSNGAGGGTSGDRYPARVTAYWQIYVDDGSGPRPFGATYEKTTVDQIRVTEVQTLVVS